MAGRGVLPSRSLEKVKRDELWRAKSFSLGVLLS
jgi:hypothetical protein